MTTRLAVLFFFAAIQVFGQNLLGTAPEASARVVVGLEQSAAGSAVPVQKLAIDLSFTEPFNPRLAAWGDLRLSSLPRAITSTAATLPVDAVKLVATVPLSELVRSGEFQAGLSYRVSGDTGFWSSLMLIASVGASTPLASAQNRFFRQYSGGVRVQSAGQTHVVDVTLGQNEAVTGGRFTGAVLRFDGLYALPVTSASFLYLFGTVTVRASPAHLNNDPGRDTYRIGVGVDFFQMLKALRNN